MPKARGDIYTFRFRLQPREVHEARRIALFVKDALRQHGLRLINLRKEPATGVRISKATGGAYADTREVIEDELARIKKG